MCSLQRCHAEVRAFFQAPTVRYATQDRNATYLPVGLVKDTVPAGRDALAATVRLADAHSNICLH